MDKSELRALIRQEIKMAMQGVASGTAGDNSPLVTEDIQQLYPGLPTITARPIGRPYGFMSRAPVGTLQITIQQGEHPGNRVVIAHRDGNVPSLNAGEATVYSVGGIQVYVSNNSIMLVGGGSVYTAVLGEPLVTLIQNLISLIVSHTHTGNMGFPTGTPLNAAQFQQLQTNNLLANSDGF